MDEPQRGPLGDAETANLQLLRSYIAANDVACPVCRYNLRGLTADICPECGQRFHLRIGSDSVRFGHFLLFLAPLLMTAGLGFFFVVLSVAMRDWPRWPQQWGFYLIIATGGLSAVLVLALYRARQRLFFRKSRRFQAAVAVLAWTLKTLVVVGCVKFGGP